MDKHNDICYTQASMTIIPHHLHTFTIDETTSAKSNGCKFNNGVETNQLETNKPKFRSTNCNKLFWY
jgi:hypothetical protein